MILQEAITGLYLAFGTVRKPTRIQHEPHELKAGEVSQLLSVPLRELSPSLMRSYLFDALYRVGSWDDFRYFLPRLLELLILDEVELEPLAYRLRYARQQSWLLTREQEVALHAFVLAYWDDLLEHWPLYANLVLEWELMEQQGPSRALLLERWWQHPNRALALAQWRMGNSGPPGEWPRDELRTWLEEAFFEATAADEQLLFSDALLILEHLPPHSKT